MAWALCAPQTPPGRRTRWTTARPRILRTYFELMANAAEYGELLRLSQFG